MTLILDLTKGVTETTAYKAWKFPGGEIHFKFSDEFIRWLNSHRSLEIQTRINTSDDFLFLLLVIDTLKKDYQNHTIDVFIPYMLYQQADRDFSVGECFSLRTVTKILNAIGVNSYTIYDPHSDVTPALLQNCKVIDNSDYIKWVLEQLPSLGKYSNGFNVVMLSPDAGAYKKIYKLANKIQFKGEVASANKSRSISTGNIDSLELSKHDFEGKDVLIVDDICIGGRTFIELAKKLKERNVGDLYLAISHGIFSNGYDELSLYYKKVFTTNSRKNEYNHELISTFNIFGDND